MLNCRQESTSITVNHIAIDVIKLPTWPRWWYISEFSGSCITAELKSSRASSCCPSCIFRLPRLISAFDRIYTWHSTSSDHEDSSFAAYFLNITLLLCNQQPRMLECCKMHHGSILPLRHIMHPEDLHHSKPSTLSWFARTSKRLSSSS